MIEIHFMPAQGGDFFWLRYGGNTFHNIIIDSGRLSCQRDYSAIMDTILESGESVDTVILTHTDSDHIGGFLGWLGREPFRMPEIKQIFFNTARGTAREAKFVPQVYPEDSLTVQKADGKYSIPQAKTILELLKDRRLLDVLIDDITMESDAAALPLGASIQFISPSRKTLVQMAMKWKPTAKSAIRYGASTACRKNLDDLQTEPFIPDASVSNGASLAFLFEFAGIKLAFLGDAFADVCVDGLRRLGYSSENPCHADIVKLSHHGSPYNLTKELLNILPSRHFLLSTSELASVRLQKITIARIMEYCCPAFVYRNCPIDALLTNEDREKHLHKDLELYHIGYGGDGSRTIGEGLILYGKTGNKLQSYRLVRRSDQPE